MADTTIGTSVAIATPDLEIIEGHVTTTSNQVAEHFNKAHNLVLRAIRNLECSEDFRLRNFAQSSYRNEQGKEQPCYRLTRDGFVFLAMGFTGKDAAQWKEAYITAFNKMERELLARTTRPTNPALDYDRISPAQAQDLKELVHAIAESKVQGFGETWARLHRKFRVNSYLELPATRFEEARDYLLGKLPEQAQPSQPDTSRMQAAFDAAAQAAAAVQKTVFNSVLAGNDEWKFGRWMLAFIDDSAKGSPAYVRQLEHGSFTTTWPRLVRDVGTGECMCTTAELLDMAYACMQRLQQRGAPALLAA
jgi:Rha family phage regulatory protein